MYLLEPNECRADFLTLQICLPKILSFFCFSSVHTRLNFEESQIAMVMLMSDGARKQWSDQDEWPHLLIFKKPALIHCQASSPIISLIGGRLSSLIATNEVGRPICVHGLRLPQTIVCCMLWTSIPISSVTVVLIVTRLSV